MPKIFICGDPHEEFAHIIDAVKEHRPDAVILVGDNTPRSPLHEELADILDVTDLWWIPGNHDTDHEDYYDNQFGSSLAEKNFHGRVVEIGGLRVAGLGGVFRTKIWNDESKSTESPEAYLQTCGKGNRWRDGLPLRHRSTIFRSQVAGLARQRADVLITHEAPDLHPFGSKVLTDLAANMRVKKAFHGHHHQDKVYPGDVWVGVGLHGIVTLDGETIRPGEVDTHGAETRE